MKHKTALITGICGQDGSYIADLLLKKDYSIFGIMRRNATCNLGNAEHLKNKIDIIEGDITDMSSILRIIQQVRPHEIYNMAAMSVHPETYINVMHSNRIEQQTIEDLWNESSIKPKKSTAETEGGKVDIEVKNLKDKSVLAYKNGAGEWFNIKQISRHKYNGKLINLKQKCGEILVTPNHSIYNSLEQLVSPIENPKMLAVRKINYKNNNKTNIRLEFPKAFIKEKGWVYLKENEKLKINLNQEDGSLQAFLRFCGAYINDGYTRSDRTCIYQDKGLEELQKDLSTFYTGTSYINKYKLEIDSNIIYYLLHKYCNKQIPNDLFLLSDNLWFELLQKLQNRITSKKMIAQLYYICAYLGIDYNFENRFWNKEDVFYKEIDYNGYVYDISVAEVQNFCAGFGNIVVHNSHVHTSFEQPLATIDIDTKGVVNILETVRSLGYTTRILHASSIAFDTPVLIKVDNKIMRTTLESAYYLWNKKIHESFEVLTSDDNGKTCFKKVLNVIDHGFKEVYKINFTLGRELIVTPDHSLITLKNDKFVETKVSDISKGDHLITFCKQEPYYYNDLQYIHNVELNEDMAYILGVYAAKGCYKHKKLVFNFKNHDRVIDIINKYFRCPFYENGTRLKIDDINVCEFFCKVIGPDVDDKKVPSEIYISPNKVKLSFLNGCLEDIETDKGIQYTIICKDFAIDIMWLLRLMGIGARLRSRKLRAYLHGKIWEILVHREDSWLHQKTVNISRIKRLPKDGLSIKFNENPSRQKLKSLGHFLGDSDLGIDVIYSIEKLKIHQRVGDFSVEDVERWYCGMAPILVHNTSEMFGVSPPPQNLETVLKPQSPYAIAKVASHNFIRLYREAYKMYCCSAVTFNHECFPFTTPVIIKKNDKINITYIGALDKESEVWDGENFVEIKSISYKRLSDLREEDRKLQITSTSMGSILTTPNHKLIDKFGEKRQARSFFKNQKLFTGNFPDMNNKIFDNNCAKFLGILCSNEYTNDDEFIHYVKKIFKNLIELDYKKCILIKEMIYDKITNHKIVPIIILNGVLDIQRSFLEGFGDEIITNSPLLAQGLLFLINNVRKSFSINIFEKDGNLYYKIDFNKSTSSIKDIFLKEVDDQYVFDIETSSGKIMAGVGNLVVGNSERRGPNFVTRKITMGVAQCLKDSNFRLKLGNLNAKRDWGYAPDFVRGFHLALQHNNPGDYIFATNETHSVKEFCEIAFSYVGLNWEDYVDIDRFFFRPAEVDILQGDFSQTKEILSWEPTVGFEELIKKMVDYDCKLLGVEL